MRLMDSMDTEPPRPVVKQPRVYTPEEEEIIINVFKYVHNSSQENDLLDSSQKTSEITGIDARDVYHMVCEKQIFHQLPPITDTVDEQTLTAIRRKIYYFFHERGYGVPRPENILREVNEDRSLPNFTMPAFLRVLRHLQFRHIITNNRFDITSRCETFSIPVV